MQAHSGGTMKSSLRADLRRLSELAFHRGEWGCGLIRRMHRIRCKAKTHPDFPLLEKFYPWLLAPLTLWPANLDKLGWLIVERTEARQLLDSQFRLLLSLLGDPPSPTTQAVAMQHEQAIQPGNYESVINAQHKFNLLEDELRHDPRFIADWNQIKAQFDVTTFQDHKKIIRRRMLLERNYRTDWDLRWSDDDERFRAVFDVFCWRWNLYGMRGDEPLLMKLTVNLTPYGTMIFIPAYWSFDPKRDLKWRAITALHKARGAQKQGPKLTLNQISLREDAERASRLWGKATNAGLKGKVRIQRVMAEMGWDARTDESKLRRLLKLVDRTSISFK